MTPDPRDTVSAALRVVGPSQTGDGAIVDHVLAVTISDGPDKLAVLDQLAYRLALWLALTARPRMENVMAARQMTEAEAVTPEGLLPPKRSAELYVNRRLWSYVWVPSRERWIRDQEDNEARHRLCREIVRGLELAPWSPPTGPPLRESTLDPPAVGEDFDLSVVGPAEIEALWLLQIEAGGNEQTD